MANSFLLTSIVSLYLLQRSGATAEIMIGLKKIFSKYFYYQ